MIHTWTVFYDILKCYNHQYLGYIDISVLHLFNHDKDCILLLYGTFEAFRLLELDWSVKCEGTIIPLCEKALSCRFMSRYQAISDIYDIFNQSVQISLIKQSRLLAFLHDLRDNWTFKLLAHLNIFSNSITVILVLRILRRSD